MLMTWQTEGSLSQIHARNGMTNVASTTFQRRRWTIRAILGFGSCQLLALNSLIGQTVITGTVREDSSGRRLAGVEVILEGANQRAVTNEAGRYVFSNLSAGRYVALFRLVGFAPVRQSVLVSNVDTVWANAALVASPVALPPLEVEAKPPLPRGIGREAFEDRRRMGFGKFFDSTVFRRSENRYLKDLLAGIPGVRIVAKEMNPGSRMYVYWAASTRRSGPRGELCFMQIVLDGVVMYRGVAPTGTRTRDPPDLWRDFEVSSLEAMEVYRSAAETPIEFGGSGADCGTIVLWSRRG